MAQLPTAMAGFAYPMWKPAFYPPNLPAKKYLEYYSRCLNSVGMNYSFRRAPSVNTIERG